jgi:regulator of sigma E protease
MIDIIIVILAVIFVLGIAINIHEFGHFAVAKLFGMRVDAYSFFGLGPRIWGFKYGHTDYRISAIPLGAYVKLYGDEATGPLEGKDEQGEVVPESELYELRPKWQKFLVMIGGPFMNLLLALAIPFAGALMYGLPSMPAPIVEFVKASGAAELAGIKTGDRIKNFDGTEDPTWERIEHDAMVSPEREVPLTVERGGERLNLTIKPTKTMRGDNAMGDLDLLPATDAEPVIVGAIEANMPAAQVLQKSDRVIAFNDQSVRNTTTLREMIGQTKGTPFKLTIERGGERKVVDINATKTPDGYRIGVGFARDEIKTREPANIAQAATFAVNSNLEIIRLTGKVFGQLFTGQRSVKEAGVAGPIGIVQIISKVVHEQGFVGLISILALISLNLGVFNLLPIPMLDGGQIAVLGIEGFLGLFGLTLSMAIKEKIQLVGLAVILLLMVTTIFFDISRLIGW